MHTKPKKRLGQNFLTDKNIQRKIVAACEFNPSDVVLEIGSGRGELTRLIAGNVFKVYALEIDSSLCKELINNLEDFNNIEIINQDVLKFNITNYFNKLKRKIKVVGNIPYYISSPIIEHLFEFKEKIDAIFITVQKEFAKRLAAAGNSKEFGSLSCFVQYYCEPKIVLNIKKNCFTPKPKVDSSLVKLKIAQVPRFIVKDQELFFKIVRASFNKRRKTLRNSLDGIISQPCLETFFDKYHVNRDIRPENLALGDFVNLTNTTT